MQKLIKGQRWVSETEPELGLGTLIDIKDRTLSVRFHASDCTRQYSLKTAPLKRIIFNVGDEIQLKDNTSFTIENLSESQGLMYYSGKNTEVCEKDVSDTISFSMPRDRLINGMTDSNKLFNLRYHLQKSKAAYDTSPVKGFLGGRVELIPHQFFIADKVTSRYIPRILLSDETGLGKTIEACLILHKLLITHRARRVLIAVPESLAHQWFVELYRKFNLSFMVFNEDYCKSLEQEGSGINPFLDHQLGIVSFDFLKNKKRQEHIIDAGWDMVVIDEAHHITDDETTHGFIKNLASTTFGLMLLTATPEQMGVKKHFLHLQLIDPERYFDFNTYCNQTAHYKKAIKTIKAASKKGKDIERILDSYGPGRVIFRNRRNVIKGFPKRFARLKGISSSDGVIQSINREFFDSPQKMDFDFTDDPRVLHLLELIKQRKKLLVICSSTQKVTAIARAVSTYISIDMAKFDETMTLVQRDRNAAWFSKKEGAQILICSEIGSEGRNFQFVHHLFLFDLPRNPELLEQRIGRVDRIGQKEDIQIHVPYVIGSAYEILARWYMDGLNLFEKNINGIHLIYKRYEQGLLTFYNQTMEKTKFDETFFQAFIKETKDYCIKVNKKLEQGKNILLELNSFKPEPAKQIIDQITGTESDHHLDKLLTLVLDHYGIETDFFDTSIFKLTPGNITDEKFPQLPRLSNAITYKRKTAIIRDDIDYFSWDHTFVQQTFDYFITNGTGSCATALLNGRGRQEILLEIIFILECVAPLHLNLERYLIPVPIRVVVDHRGNDVTLKNEFTHFSKHLVQDQSTWFRDLEPVKQDIIPAMIEKGILIAKGHSDRMIEKGNDRIKDIIGKEISRLQHLIKINPNINEKEICLAQTRMGSLLDHLSSARLRIDALRLIRVQ